MTEWKYPYVEKIALRDCGFKIGAIVADGEGSKTALEWRLADIIDHAQKHKMPGAKNDEETT